MSQFRVTGEFELKQMICEIGKRIWTRGYVAANDGNITVKINDKEILTTPTGISKGYMTPDMISKVDLKGKILSGNSRYRPSSEVKMHLEVYRERPDVKSVVHAHPPYCTSFAVAGIPLNKCVLPEAIIVIGAVPIAKYGLPSTMEIPDSIRQHIKTSDAILLENHGALSLGSDLNNAYFKMETLELTAHIVWNAVQLGNVNVLPEGERDRLMNIRENYGLTGPITLCDTNPVQNNVKKDVESPVQSKDNSNKVSDDTIRKITDGVLARLK